MLTSNIQNVTRSFISNVELICTSVRRFPCVVIRNSIETLQSSAITPFNGTVTAVCTIANTVFSAAIVACSLDQSPLPRPVLLAMGIFSGLSGGLLTGGIGLYCIRKINAHELSPDPRPDSEMILSELVEYAATNNNDVVIDVEDIEQD